MARKETAISFLKMTAAGHVRAAYAQYVAPHFIHHNQYFKGDRQSLMLAMEDASKKTPNKTIETKQAFEEGDSVITFSHVTRQNADDLSIAVVHIFRFESDRIVELWDLGQQVMKDSPNENGIF